MCCLFSFIFSFRIVGKIVIVGRIDFGSCGSDRSFGYIANISGERHKLFHQSTVYRIDYTDMSFLCTEEQGHVEKFKDDLVVIRGRSGRAARILLVYLSLPLV